MRLRLLVAALAVAAVAAFLIRGTGRGAAPPLTPPAARRVAARPAGLPAPPAVRRMPTRNLFEYGEGHTAPAAPPVAAPLPYVTREGPAPSPSPAVRVAGLVRRGAELKAALVVDGEMTVAGKGDRAGRYTVLEVDDEAGVRLRSPTGEEMVLPPPPF